MPVAVITGGASGMGRTICHHLARRGTWSQSVHLDGEGAERVAKELRAEGGLAVACQVDVSDRVEVDHAMQVARRGWGPWGSS